MKALALLPASTAVLFFGVSAFGEVRVNFEHNLPEKAEGDGFTFKAIPRPARNDAGATAKISILAGSRDRNGGDVAKLSDGRLPRQDDEPSQNLFFDQGTNGGRIWLDLGRVVDIKQINSYSRHVDVRAPQVYKLYATDGAAPGFDAAKAKDGDPVAAGWKLVASVDTRPKDGKLGGSYGVSITDSLGTIGKYRHLLLDVARTGDNNPFANTFYSEIDIIDAAAPAPEPAEQATPPKTFTSADGKYQFAIDTTLAPDLADWCEKQLSPVIQVWYPKLVTLLPSDGFKAPERVAFEFREDMGGTPAYAAGNRISLNVQWFRKNIDGEGKGAVVHEMVHVVQQYQRARREQNAIRPPGWVVEGIPDYVRWFLYEPQSHGAEITQRNVSRASYDASYRVTANFFDWLTANHGKDIVVKLNAAARDGRYSDDFWKEATGKTVQELGAEWKKFHEDRLAGQVGKASAPN